MLFEGPAAHKLCPLFCISKGLPRTLKNNFTLITENTFSEALVSSVCRWWLAWFLEFVFGTGINTNCSEVWGK